MKRRSSDRPRRPVSESILRQIEAAEKVLSFARLLLGGFAALLLWAARLQWNVADLQAKVGEIQEDRRTHIKDADTWRHDVDFAKLHRDEAIAALARVQTPAAAAVESARVTRAH